jgi:hypothetical protein
VIRNRQFGESHLRRWAAQSCVLLVLLMIGVEATHAHPDAASARASSPCAICISAHAKAPVATFHALPTLSTLETLSIPFQVEGKGLVKEISLFIRPPPFA